MVAHNHIANNDEWTNGTVIHLWGACLQEGNDPRRAYVRTWDSQVPRNRAGAVLGATGITALNATEPPLTIYGPGSNLAGRTLFQVSSGGEPIIADGSANGYRLAELMSATNPSDWAGVLKATTPAGTTVFHRFPAVVGRTAARMDAARSWISWRVIPATSYMAKIFSSGVSGEMVWEAARM